MYKCLTTIHSVTDRQTDTDIHANSRSHCVHLDGVKKLYRRVGLFRMGVSVAYVLYLILFILIHHIGSI